MWLTFGWTPQPRCQCRQALYSNFQGIFHQHPCHNQHQVSTAIVGPPNAPSKEHIDHDAPVMCQLWYLCIWGHPPPLWLESLPISLPRLQGSCIQIPRNIRFVGKQGHWCMVRWSISWPLPMQSFFHPRDAHIPDIRLRQIVLPRLPGAVPHVEQTLPRGNWHACHTIERNTCSKKVRVSWKYQKQISHQCPTSNKENTQKPYPWMALTSGQPAKGAHHHPP